jgi:hypothetical protein
MRKTISVALLVAFTGIATPGVAAAGPDNGNSFTVTLSCADGRTFTGTSISQSSGRPFDIAEDSGVLVQLTGSYVDLDNPSAPPVVFETTPGGGRVANLLTCVYDTVYFGARLRVTGGFLDTTR